MSITLIPSQDIPLLVSLLRDAEEGDERIISTLQDPTMSAYLAFDGDSPIGAVVIQWVIEDSELIYIATDSDRRGRGYGKAIVQLLLEEARQRGVKAVSVGTANSSWSNIAFYQKCGFRMHSVKHNYFDYIPTPIYEDGIRMQDMLMLRFTLAESSGS